MEPWSGSVRPKQPINSPLASLGKYFLRCASVPNLKIGETSELIRSGAGLHILRLAEKKGDVVKFEDQTLLRHILVQPSEIRSEKQTENLINEIYEKLIASNEFKQLARQYSEDPGSKMEGGDLGWSTANTFDPAFEKVMKSGMIVLIG